MTTLTKADLSALGMEVQNGRAVRVANTDTDPGDADTSWQEMQRKCYRVFEKAGCEVWWLSQARRTRQTAGLPDLLIFGPPGAPFMTFWETKAGKGRLSEAQRRFAAHCQRTGIEFQCGGEFIARRWLQYLMKQYGGKR